MTGRRGVRAGTGHPHVAVAVGVALLTGLLVLGPVAVIRAVAASSDQAADAPRTYRPPVVAPVADPFRPPPEPWLPGNRGIEYGTVPGTPIRAIGRGTVTFAGPVAGSLHVTVTHPDGLRSSYSFLAAIRTVLGRQVAGGEVVGIAGARLHLGVRRGDVYLDPASLWGTPVRGGRVGLVPLDGGISSGGGPVDERAGLPSAAPSSSASRSPSRSSGRRRDRAGGGPGTTLAISWPRRWRGWLLW